MSIGEKIKQRRTDLNLSQEELANKLGYTSRSTINKIEKGINNVTQSKVIDFARALNTTPLFLMGLENEKINHCNIEDKLPKLSNDELKQVSDYIDFLIKRGDIK